MSIREAGRFSLAILLSLSFGFSTSLRAQESSPPSNSEVQQPAPTPEDPVTSSTSTGAPVGKYSAPLPAHADMTEKRPAAAAHPSKPAVLYGRIEELCAGDSATLPLKLKPMQPMQPMRDTTRDTALQSRVESNLLNGKASNNLQSYPIDFLGTWSGELTIFSSTFAPIRFEFDRSEAEKEHRLMRPGTKGQCSVTFYRGNSGNTQLEPCEVTFTTTMDSGAMRNQMRQMFGNNPQLGSMFGNSSFMNAQIPYMYALHLGNLTAGTGVTGNQLKSQLVQNQLRQLTQGVMEQVVVTHDTDRNPSSGKTRLSYSESVLRFTKLDRNRLYLQAASVNYRNDGKFEDKVILYGTLNRVSGGSSSGYPSSSFDAGLGGGQAVQQLQQMIQQMQNMSR